MPANTLNKKRTKAAENAPLTNSDTTPPAQNNVGLPDGWRWVKLGDLCLPKEGLRRGPFGSAIKKEFFVPTGYKVYEQGNAIYDDPDRGRYYIDEDKYYALINFNVKPGDLIVSCSGTLGRIAEIPSNAKPGVINQALLRIRLIDGIIAKKFFLYYFRSASFQKRIFDESQGTAMSNLIGIKDFKEIELLIPPLPVQHAIVSKIEELLSELNKGKQQLETAQQQLRIYRQAVLKWAFEGRLTNENVKDCELPEGWRRVLLGNVLKVSSGKGLKVNQLTGGEFPVYGGNGQNGFHTDYFIEEPKLIIGRVGVKCGVTHITKPKAWVTDNALIVEPLTSDFNMTFFKLKLEYENLNKLSVSTAQPVISGSKIYAYEIVLPPLAHQLQIVQQIETRLSVCDKLEETINQSLAQSETLRQSILKKAFEGKLV